MRDVPSTDARSEQFDPAQLVRSDIIAMDPYVPIVPFEVLSKRLGHDPQDIVKLDANENPFGPSPRALDALRQPHYWHIYPDPEAGALRDALADYTGVDHDHLLAGAGADELIDLVLRAVLEPGQAVFNCPPSFGMYPFSTAVNMGRLVDVPRRDDFSLDLAAVEAAVRAEPQARVLFVCSPNNPDGSVISSEALKRLLNLPLLVVLDEAYVEFSGDSRIHWVQEHDNLVVLRTFSKWAGLAGLRVGYGAFPRWLLPHLWKIKQPYNVNVPAAQAAIASLQDGELLLQRVQTIVEERRQLERELAGLDFLEPYPSRSNFVLCRVVGRDAAQLKQALEKEGVLVRYFAKPGLDNCIRISAGRPQDSDRLLQALRSL
ncbi:MAG TPA: histidinol-phosphate transaminase [Candidatus Sulfomarinibacteraceae bacterium]|nr:histidinol-phosphate transaminase [Candidatus Sulfomarinibacteraceae bacterium]